jgi:hypothetical protein
MVAFRDTPLAPWAVENSASRTASETTALVTTWFYIPNTAHRENSEHSSALFIGQATISAASGEAFISNDTVAASVRVRQSRSA